MIDAETTPDPVSDHPRPGPFAWTVIVAGWIVMAVAVRGAVRDDRLGGIETWAPWIVGAALVHDLVVLPLVVAVGWVLARLVPLPWRVPLRTALVVAAVVSLAVWPIAQRWGARADNPSILPLPVARNLAVLCAALVLAALGVGAVRAWRDRRATPHRTEERP